MTMQLPAAVTMDNAVPLAAGLPAQLGSGTGPVTVDASALQHYDSSTLALLLQARRLAEQAGRAFRVEGAPPSLQALAQLYGVDGLLSMSSASEARTPA